MQLAPAGFHAMLDDRHAEPGTAGIFLRLFAPEERFGDVLHFLGGDAGGAVGEFHANKVPPVSYTPLTLPTKREGYSSSGGPTTNNKT